MFSSSVILCNKKVITEEIGQLVFSVILALLCTHYAFELAYNPASQQVMEFLQENFLGTGFLGRPQPWPTPIFSEPWDA